MTQITNMENLQNLAKFYHFEYQRALRLLEVEADRPSGISLLLEPARWLMGGLYVVR